MVNTAPTVTTPVPPIPVTNTETPLLLRATAGSGNWFNQASGSNVGAGLRSSPPRTETKLGQNPLAQL